MRVAGVKIGDIGSVDAQGRARDRGSGHRLRVRRPTSCARTPPRCCAPRPGSRTCSSRSTRARRSAPAVKNGFTIPINNTLPDVNPDEVLSALDSGHARLPQAAGQRCRPGPQPPRLGLPGGVGPLRADLSRRGPPDRRAVHPSGQPGSPDPLAAGAQRRAGRQQHRRLRSWSRSRPSSSAPSPPRSAACAPACASSRRRCARPPSRWTRSTASRRSCGPPPTACARPCARSPGQQAGHRAGPRGHSDAARPDPPLRARGPAPGRATWSIPSTSWPRPRPTCGARSTASTTCSTCWPTTRAGGEPPAGRGSRRGLPVLDRLDHAPDRAPVHPQRRQRLLPPGVHRRSLPDAGAPAGREPGSRVHRQLPGHRRRAAVRRQDPRGRRPVLDSAAQRKQRRKDEAEEGPTGETGPTGEDQAATGEDRPGRGPTGEGSGNEDNPPAMTTTAPAPPSSGDQEEEE